MIKGAVDVEYYRRALRASNDAEWYLVPNESNEAAWIEEQRSKEYNEAARHRYYENKRKPGIKKNTFKKRRLRYRKGVPPTQRPHAGKSKLTVAELLYLADLLRPYCPEIVGYPDAVPNKVRKQFTGQEAMVCRELKKYSTYAALIEMYGTNSNVLSIVLNPNKWPGLPELGVYVDEESHEIHTNENELRGLEDIP